jgi:hypothetical protein
MNQVSQIEERSRRLYFKSMGAILTKQEIMAEQYRTRILAAPSVPESDSGSQSDED